MKDTIFAPSTPTGGAIAVIRISGEGAIAALQSVFSSKKPFISREMRFGKLMDGTETVDEVMACVFKGPMSYTGEDMAEVYTHGGHAVVKRVLELLLKQGLRPAEPGEFTQRAFMNGKMGLDEAEAVMDVINAQTKRSAASAMEQMAGSVGRHIGRIEAELIDVLTGIDAAIDYPDELEEDVFSAVPQQLEKAKSELDELIRSGERGRLLRDGAVVAILGAPNAGKSSLFNALLGHNRAIVTNIPGTTRDIIEENLSVEGVPVRLLDTAGIRETEDVVEGIGVEIAKKSAETADAVILAFDAGIPLTEEDKSLIAETAALPRLAALCKSDLPAAVTENDMQELGVEAVSISSVTGEGLDRLRNALAKRLLPREENALVTNTRHIKSLRLARAALDDAVFDLGTDCAATALHSALAHLGEITGTNVTETVIDNIFSKFCVGK